MSALGTLDHLTRPADGEPEGALVLFHGRGSDERDLYPLLDVLDPERRRLGIAPRGPLSLPPGGAHWYVVPRIGFPDPPTFHATYAVASAWLDALAEETGIPPGRTILGGFSQGAVMSYALGLGRGRPRPEAIVALSGFIPTVPEFEIDLSQPLPPVAIGHGVHDEVIALSFAHAARDALQAAGAPLLYREFPLPHAIDRGFLEEVRTWLASR
jgi:phospholipase/carboxylesterase